MLLKLAFCLNFYFLRHILTFMFMYCARYYVILYNWFRQKITHTGWLCHVINQSIKNTALRTGSSYSILGVETLLFLAQLSLNRFYDANEVINTVHHTQRHILIWRVTGSWAYLFDAPDPSMCFIGSVMRISTLATFIVHKNTCNCVM